MIDSGNIATPERYALLALLKRGSLRRAASGWRNGSKIFSASTIGSLIGRGYVKQGRLSKYKLPTVYLTDSGKSLARNEAAKLLGHEADRLMEMTEATR